VGGAPGVLSSNYRLLQANLFLWAFFGHCWQKYETLLMMVVNKYYQAHIKRLACGFKNSILEGLIPDLVFKNGPDIMDPDLILMLLSLLTSFPALVPFCYKI
jgi:hypothetical protein